MILLLYITFTADLNLQLLTSQTLPGNSSRFSKLAVVSCAEVNLRGFFDFKIFVSTFRALESSTFREKSLVEKRGGRVYTSPSLKAARKLIMSNFYKYIFLLRVLLDLSPAF